MKEHDRYAVDFIEACRTIKRTLPGCLVSGGVSNLSFAYRGNETVRRAMHSAFLYHAIEAGMEATVTPKYPGATTHTAVVTVVDRVVDAASDTFGVRMELPNPGLEIPGGVRCDVRFTP